ncbi:MAG: phosphatidylserine decarboxylase family protein [Parcubacteria group bacterium CG10_big_fil_rev_8_21_14_0_10_36_14]|nr:MAG: phosphatidylserine decarboxylase family protein [Parcubacteria group bacterium CG10_big_fil_rev_8_21_14_0_10_36_14]
MRYKHITYRILFTFGVLTCFIFFGWQWFHRIPDRDIPANSVVVSPANGRIIYVEKVDNETIHFFKNEVEQIVDTGMKQSPYVIIVIEMNIHNVHIQRAPITGIIVLQDHMQGVFKNAIFSDDKVHLANTNEKTLTVFENENGGRVGVVQVAGILARRIESWKVKGDKVAKGEPYGIIKLGSQVVLILPSYIEPLVEIGQVVVDGETVIGNFPSLFDKILEN